MAVDYEAAFGYPVRGDGAVKRFLIGGGLPSLLTIAFFGLAVVSVLLAPVAVLLVLLAPVAFVIGLGLNGFYVRVVRETMAGSDEPPAFDDWKGLVVDGGYCFLVAFGYSIPLIVVGVVATAVFLLVVGGGAAMGGSEMESAVAALGLVSLLVFALISLLATVYGLAVSYLYPISVCIYADTGDLRACFSRERLLAVAKSGDYAIPWLVQAGVLFGIQTVVGMLTMVLIGYLLYPFLPFATFFVSTAAFYMFAKAYAGTVDEQQRDDADAGSVV